MDELKDWDKPIRVPIEDIDFDTPCSDSPVADEASTVEDTQSAIDDFVKNIGTSADHPADDRKPPPKKAPKLRYALYDNEPVSIRMRTTQKSVVDGQESARSKPLAPLDALPDKPADDSPAGAGFDNEPDNEPTTSSGGLAPNFDDYIAKCDALVSELAKADQYIQRAVTAAQQADSDFASFSPQAVAFCDELVLLLKGTDDILKAVEDLLELPLHYRVTLTDAMKKWLQGVDADWSKGLLVLIDQLFLTVNDTKKALLAFRNDKNTVQ
ncbi:hypothetical protein AA313_de0203234 [Arthrobotrys entomopaga]|nr:hypothetical protein AA313_de0203234 [Arthrobotrys entomopaga]